MKRTTIVLCAVIWILSACTNDDGKKIIPGEIWTDDNGVHINAHGGGILYNEADKTYYWYGEHKTDGVEGNVANQSRPK